MLTILNFIGAQQQHLKKKNLIFLSYEETSPVHHCELKQVHAGPEGFGSHFSLGLEQPA